MLVLLRESGQIRAIDALLVWLWLRREKTVLGFLTPSHVMLATLCDSEAISFEIFRDNAVMKLAIGRLKQLRVCGFFDTVSSSSLRL